MKAWPDADTQKNERKQEGDTCGSNRGAQILIRETRDILGNQERDRTENPGARETKGKGT